MKKFIFFAASATVFFVSGTVGFARAAAVSGAEPLAAETESIINADRVDLEFRITALRKVAELSIAEALDLKNEILAYTDEDIGDSDISAWRERAVSRISDALRYYETVQSELVDEGIADIEMIQKIAFDFKEWREETYIPLVGEISDFLLIQKTNSILSIAERRWNRIKDDVLLLQKLYPEDGARVAVLLEQSRFSLDAGKSFWQDARDLFKALYFTFSLSAASKTASVSPEASSTSPSIELPENGGAAASSSSERVASGAEEQESVPSVLDLVRFSVQNIRDAYKTFIEMSNFVRELFI